MPGLLRIILQRRPTLHAGIVDKNFNRTYLIFHMTDGATDGRAVYDVECCFCHAVAEFPERFGSFVHLLRFGAR